MDEWKNQASSHSGGTGSVNGHKHSWNNLISVQHCCLNTSYLKKKALDTRRQVPPLQGYYAAVQELADCAVKGRGSDPDGHASLWGPDCECDRGPHLDCCHSQSGARNVARAGGQALHVGGWCRRGSPWKALREERDLVLARAPLINRLL